MAKMKVTLGRLADFKMPVDFVAQNGDEMKMTFTVRHIKRDEFVDRMNEKPKPKKGEPSADVQFIKFMATGWDIADYEFNDENIAELVELYPAVVLALTQNYLSAMVGQRVKN